MPAIQCNHCQQTFNARPCEIKSGKRFCSKKCYSASRIGAPTWNKGLSGWRTKEHTQKLIDITIQRNKEKPISSENARINGIKAKRNTGPQHKDWKGGRKKTQAGYVYVLAKDHPRQQDGYVFEHIVVLEQHLGRLLNDKEVVHHINQIRDDNRLENLCLMFRSDHTSLHHKGTSKKRRTSI